jgi:putative peptidoglycan lipid II flippase
MFQLSFVFRNLKFYRPVIYLKHPGFKKLFKLAVPSLLSSSIAQVNILITSMFTTFFPRGSIVALSTADKIWQTPYGIFAQGIGTALLPTLSTRYALGEKEDYKDVLIKGLKSVLLLTVPSAAGLAALRKPIISFFKFSNLFDDASIMSAQNLLLFFTIALIGQSIVAILNRGFYAVNDTKTPLYVGSGTIAMNLLLCYIFYGYTNLGVAGMSLAYSITSILNAVMLLSILNRKINGLHLSKLAGYFIRIGAASAIMGLVLYLMNSGLNMVIGTIDFNAITSSALIKMKLLQLLTIAVEIAVGAAVYFIACILLKVNEAEYVFKQVKGKLKRAFSFAGHKHKG